MSYIERQAARLMLKVKLGELHGESFEEFFQDLMCAAEPSFVDVRTAGSLGDQSSDGLLLNGRKLYACYGPEVFDASRVKAKFESDISGALSKRRGAFDCFVFVHNDLKGLHPTLTKMLSESGSSYDGIAIELFGHRRFREYLMKLDKVTVEDVLGAPLPVDDLVYSVSMEELEPLLNHLAEVRHKQPAGTDIHPVSMKKLSYNKFSEDEKADLRRMMVRSPDIESYYMNRIDVAERDEVAAAFQAEYRRVRETTNDPDEVLWYLEQYVLGNASPPPLRRRAAGAVLAYFFETCDIFEDAPSDWTESEVVEV